MPFGEITRTLRRYPKTCGTVGILTTCSLLVYERERITSFFDQFNESKPQKTDNKKRPDYIYIKYHIYKESMRKLKQKEEDDKKWISIIINPIGKWWKSIKHSVAWRLLNIAQNGDQHERLKAVRQLAHIDHLKDWDFRHLAQICDARTAVSLARSGADQRWFVPVHMRGFVKNPKLVLSDLRDMLSRLDGINCVQHFFSKYFPTQDPPDDISEFLTPEQSISQTSAQDTVLLKEIISFIHHITKNADIAEQIVKEGGLTQLMELRKIFDSDNETLSTLCKILANLSLVKDSVEHFYVSGWIGTLAEWQTCPDIRLQVISAKAMANLDHDDPNYSVYPPNVYPLHPRQRVRNKPKADIVFVHGLLGGVFITWRQKDRKPSELGLYGKNAFYSNDADDIFLVGDQRRVKSQNGNGQNKAANGATNHKNNDKSVNDAPILKTATKHEQKPLEISDQETKEFVENLRNEGELDPDWEVVHPDVPLDASNSATGSFSVAGNQWDNQDNTDDYTNCWPMEWLPDNYPNTRIIGIDYTSAVSEWSANFTKFCPCEKDQGHIDIRSTTLLERIAMSDVGNDRPIIWIGHSMGGLLTKLMLMKAVDHKNPKINQVARNTSSIVFLGTPHRGSPIAKWKQHMQLILSPSIEVKEMEENSPKLLELHKNFMGCLRTCFRNIKIISIAEGTPTMLTSFKFPLRIVTEDSARIDCGDFYLLKDDHLSLSKPIFRQSFLYQRMLRVIEETLKREQIGDKEDETEVLEKTIKIQTKLLSASTLKSLLQDVLSLVPNFAYRITT